jgi:hypothetical protein
VELDDVDTQNRFVTGLEFCLKRYIRGSYLHPLPDWTLYSTPASSGFDLEGMTESTGFFSRAIIPLLEAPRQGLERVTVMTSSSARCRGGELVGVRQGRDSPSSGWESKYLECGLDNRVQTDTP